MNIEKVDMFYTFLFNFINAQRKVALKLPQFEMLYKGLLFVYLSTSVDRILNGVHVPLSSVPGPIIVPIFHLSLLHPNFKGMRA